jgi:hypothetical protein
MEGDGDPFRETLAVTEEVGECEVVLVTLGDTDAVILPEELPDAEGDTLSEDEKDGDAENLGDADAEIDTVRVRVALSKPEIVVVRLKDFVDVKLSEEEPDSLDKADCVAERRIDVDIVGDCDEDRVRDGEAELEDDAEKDAVTDAHRERRAEPEFVTDME